MSLRANFSEENVRSIEIFYALKLHFETQKYDAVRYGCRIKTRDSSKIIALKGAGKIIRRFHTIASKDISNFYNYCLANSIHLAFNLRKIWIDDFSVSVRNDWLARMESLCYKWNEARKRFLEQNVSSEDAFYEMMGGVISPETFILLNLEFGLAQSLNEDRKEDLLWIELRRVLRDYEKLLCQYQIFEEIRSQIKDEKERCRKDQNQIVAEVNAD